ncbi:MAG: hypothetical protein ACQKBT_11730 [Puniceicoccales bacterium]
MNSPAKENTFRKLLLSAWAVSAIILVIQIVLILTADPRTPRDYSVSPFTRVLERLPLGNLFAFIGIPIAVVGTLWTLYHIAYKRDIHCALLGLEAALIGVIVGAPISNTTFVCTFALLACIVWEQLRDRVWPPDRLT